MERERKKESETPSLVGRGPKLSECDAPPGSGGGEGTGRKRDVERKRKSDPTIKNTIKRKPPDGCYYVREETPRSSPKEVVKEKKKFGDGSKCDHHQLGDVTLLPPSPSLLCTPAIYLVPLVRWTGLLLFLGLVLF